MNTRLIVTPLAAVAKKAAPSLNDLITNYLAAIRKSLVDVGISINHKVVDMPDCVNRKNIVLEFFRGEQRLGSAIRSIDSEAQILRLSTIGLDGGTGILRPLYKAESTFANQAGLNVRSRLANAKTEAKFREFYPGFQSLKGGRTLLWIHPNNRS